MYVSILAVENIVDMIVSSRTVVVKRKRKTIEVAPKKPAAKVARGQSLAPMVKLVALPEGVVTVAESRGPKRDAGSGKEKGLMTVFEAPQMFPQISIPPVATPAENTVHVPEHFCPKWKVNLNDRVS